MRMHVCSRACCCMCAILEWESDLCRNKNPLKHAIDVYKCTQCSKQMLLESKIQTQSFKNIYI